ncbi:putative ribonuclease H-like domain-containing protein [Tanacetum coccineum]
MVAQGYTKEEGIDYDKRDVKSAFLYGTIEEEVYVCQPLSFEDPQFPDKVYKVEKLYMVYIKLLEPVYVNDIIFGSIKKSLCDEFEQMMHKKFQMSSMGELTFFLGLQVQQKKDGIFISQDKYVVDILKKFDFITVKTTSTPMEPNKALVKDEEADSVDVHLYRSMIGSLIYLKGQPKLGLWYPRDSPFDLEAFSDSDYAGASLDRKSTTGGCQFLGKRLISWQCKKQTIVANSTTEAEYVAAANCCGQVLWIQNQMLDYGFNFMNTKIYIDNESTICVVKNPVFHFKTKHIEIRHYFIRDSYEKKLIQVMMIHLTTRFEYKKELAIPGKMTTGKEFSNPLMAGSLPKTISVQIVDFLSTCLISYALTVSPTIYASYIEQFWNTATSKTVNSVKQIHAIVDGKTVVITESSVRNDLLFDDEDAPGSESSVTPPEPQPIPSTSQPNVLEPQTGLLQTETPPTVSHEPHTEANIEQILPSLSIYQRKHKKTQKHRRAKKVIKLPQTSMPPDFGADKGMDTSGSLKHQETMRGAPAHTRSGRVLKQPNEPPLLEGHTSRSREGMMAHTFEFIDIAPPTLHDSPFSGGYIPGSDEGRLKLEELMAMCIKLSKQVLDLEKEKDAQAVEILKLKKRVKKLERQRKSSISHLRKRIYSQVESSNDDLDEQDISK